MKYTKSRIFGLITLILAIIVGLCGIFASVAEKEGTPFYNAYAQATLYASELSDVTAAVTDAQDALDRVTKRAGDAVDESAAALETAQEALEIEQNGDYDPETDVGALGQSILEAQEAGEDVSSILESYSLVANAETDAVLDEALTTVKRAESAAEDAVAALEDAIEKALIIDPDAAFDDLPVLSEAETTELGDLTGAERLVTRGENYVARSETVTINAEAINEAGSVILTQVQAVADANPSPVIDKMLSFAVNRNVDFMVVGGILLVVALLLLLAPAWLAAKWKLPLFRKGFWFVLVVSLLAAALHYADGEMWDLMREGVYDTLYMTLPSTFFAYVVGLPLGVLLVITSPGHIRPNPTLNNVMGTIVNFLRSIPFIILLVMLFDVTRLVMGAAIGTRAVIFPLFVSAFPYVARIVEGSINEVDRGVIEAAQSMGSSTWQIIRKVLIPEALPSLINGAAICMTTILSYTAMAGSAGGDGLGKIAITYGLNYREYDIMYVSSLLLVALVQIIQIAGGILMRAADHRRK